MKGKLIVIDGLDGSGKSTQAQLLYQRLKQKSEKVALLSYPDYAQPSSTLVKMYLNGEFSQNPDEINAYAASTFYAADRYASYMQFWREKYQQGYLLVASRYVSSNAIHQMVKLPETEWHDFLGWLRDYEYDKLKLPKPDQVIFLKMSRKVADQLILARYHGEEQKKDIHESNRDYLNSCMKSAQFAAEQENWTVISCCDGEHPYPVEEIAEKIYQEVKKACNI